jgi:hypothetical protein
MMDATVTGSGSPESRREELVPRYPKLTHVQAVQVASQVVARDCL